MSLPSSCEVVIVGGGVAGASAAYHLMQAGVKDIVVLECGAPGVGRSQPIARSSTDKIENENEETAFAFSQRSGSSVMSAARTIKMMVRLFASSASDFISHHGEDGARRYLKLTTIGIKTERDLALKFLPNPDIQIRNTGSLYLAYEKDEQDLRDEFETLRRLGCKDIEWWDKPKVVATPGCPIDFHCAIYFPDDAIINSEVYAAALLQAAVSTGAVRLFEQCSPVIRVSTEKLTDGNSTEPHWAMTVLEDGTHIASRHAVLATGGLFTGDPNLSGLLRPCWSYLVAMPHPEAETAPKESTHLSDGTPKFSHNFFTWGFTHDWCWTEGAVRISGEDHYSALKPPRSAERCGALAQWTCQAYPEVFGRPAGEKEGEGACSVNSGEFAWQYGVYSETPDSAPIVGHTDPSSRVCYLLGCNAWGQAVLSYAATLVPGLLDYEALSEEQQDLFSLLTIQRFSLLPSVRNGNN